MTAREFWEVWAKNFGSRGFHSLTKSTAFDFAEAYAEQVVSSKAAGAPGGQHILMPGEMSNDLLAPAAPSERGDELAENFANDMLSNLRANVADDKKYRALAGSSAKTLRETGEEFLLATERLLDWMNGSDLSADHKEQRPEDYQRLCAALTNFKAAIRGRAGLSSQEGK